MALDQMFIQLGISGAVILIGYRLALRWMNIQREVEQERTLAIREGFAADIAAHQEITKTMQAISNQAYRIEGKLDMFFDLTPVRNMYPQAPPPPRTEPSVIVQQPDEETTPVDKPAPSRKTPPRGVPSQPAQPTQPYGPFVWPKADKKDR